MNALKRLSQLLELPWGKSVHAQIHEAFDAALRPFGFEESREGLYQQNEGQLSFVQYRSGRNAVRVGHGSTEDGTGRMMLEVELSFGEAGHSRVETLSTFTIEQMPPEYDPVLRGRGALDAKLLEARDATVRVCQRFLATEPTNAA